MKDFLAKTVVITGAASGIGQSLALQLAQKGAYVAISDVNTSGLEETKARIIEKGGRVMADTLDIADRAAVEAYAEKVNKTFGGVDVVINNAGVALMGWADEVSYEDFERVMNINFWGVVYGTRAFLPFLKQAPEAYIVNISSLFGLLAFPTQSVYNASKFAVRGFTESLRYELEGTSVKPVCIHPGGIDTNIVRNAKFSLKPKERGGASRDLQRAADMFHKIAMTSPDKAAQKIINGVLKSDKRVLIGPDAKFLDVIQRVWPASYDRMINFFFTKTPFSK